MRSMLVAFVGFGVLVSVIGCSSGSGSASGDNQPKLAKQADPKLQPTAPTGGAGSPKASSQ